MHRIITLCLLALVTIPFCTRAQTNESTSTTGTASVTFYRLKRMVGSDYKPSVYVDAKQVLRLGNGRYYTIQLPVGRHAVESNAKNRPPREVELKAGESAFFEMIVLPGFYRVQGLLIPVSADEAEEAMKKLKRLDAKWVIKDSQGMRIALDKGL